MNKKVIKIMASVIVVAAASGGIYFAYNKIKNGKKSQQTAKYYTVKAMKSNLNVTVSGTGQVFASVTKDVSANNAGEIKSLSAKVGDSISKGAVICSVYSDQLQQQVNTASTTLQSDQLQLSDDQASQSSGQDNSKGSAQNQNTENLQTKIQQDQNAISKDQLKIQQDQNNLNTANTNLSEMTLTSPIDGVITAVNDSNGDSVQSGKAVVSIMDPTSFKVNLSVDELDVAKVKPGQTANIEFDAMKDKEYTGKVESISPVGTTSNNVTTYEADIDLDNKDGVKSGMDANVTINVDSKSDALVVPTEAVIDNNGSKYVMVPSSSAQSSGASSSTASNGSYSGSAGNKGNSGNKGSSGSSGGWSRKSGSSSGSMRNTISGQGAKLVKVTTGLENQDYVEITSGLSEGESVMIKIPDVSSSSSSQSKGFGSSFGGLGGGSFGGSSRMASGKSNSSGGSSSSGASSSSNGSSNSSSSSSSK